MVLSWVVSMPYLPLDIPWFMGIIKLINFAHGDIYMMGAFVGYYAINSLGMNFWVALVFAMLVTGRF